LELRISDLGFQFGIMVISVSDVKKLREETSAGVIEVKKALEDSGGDLEEAKKLLQERGVARAQKKAEREAAEGLVTSYIHNGGKIGVLIEVFCETDFVARTDDFQKLSKELAMQVAATDPGDANELFEQEYIRDPSKIVQDLVNETIAKVGENIRVGRLARFQI